MDGKWLTLNEAWLYVIQLAIAIPFHVPTHTTAELLQRDHATIHVVWEFVIRTMVREIVVQVYEIVTQVL